MKHFARIVSIMLAISMLLGAGITSLSLINAAPDTSTQPTTVAWWKLQNDSAYYTGSVNGDDLTFKDVTDNGNDLVVAKEGNADNIATDVFQWSTINSEEEFANDAATGLYFGNTMNAAQSVDPYNPDDTSWTGAYVSGKYLQTVSNAPINTKSFENGYTMEIIFSVSPDYNVDYNRYTGLFSRQGLMAGAGKDGVNEPCFSMAQAELINDFQLVSLSATDGKNVNKEVSLSFEFEGDFVHMAVVNDGETSTVYLNKQAVAVEDAGSGIAGADLGFGWEVGVGRKDATGQKSKNENYAGIGSIRRLFCGTISEIKVTEGELSPDDFLYSNEVRLKDADDNGYIDISTEEELLKYRDTYFNMLTVPEKLSEDAFTSMNAELKADIMLSDPETPGTGNFKTIGKMRGDIIDYYSNFNGNGYTISNMQIVETTSGRADIGMFGNCRNNAEISNLTIKDSSVKVECGGSGNNVFVGVLCAGGMFVIANNHIINCTVDVNSAQKQSDSSSAAALAGAPWDGLSISNCTVDAATKVTSTNIANTAGIVGLFAMEMHIEDCVSAATVKGTINVGGIVGRAIWSTATEATVTGCVNKGKVTSDNVAGGLIGVVAGANVTVDGCANWGEITGATGKTGNLVGNVGNSGTIDIVRCMDLSGKDTALFGNENNLSEAECHKLTNADKVGEEISFNNTKYQNYGKCYVDVNNGFIYSEDKTAAATDKFATGISIKNNGDKHAVLFTALVNIEALKDVQSVNITIKFNDGGNTVIREWTKKLGGSENNLNVYGILEAAGKVYFAADGYAYLGIVVNNIPDYEWSTADLTITDGTNTDIIYVSDYIEYN